MLGILKKLQIFHLSNRYIPALVLIGVLVILSYENSDDMRVSIENDGKLINISGRQRMLSQKLIIDAKNYIIKPNQNNKKIFQNSITIMEKSHIYLLNTTLSIKLKKIYFDEKLDEEIKNYLKDFKSILKSKDQEKLDKLRLSSKDILKKLDNVVLMYEKENSLKMEMLKERQKLLYILMLLVLLLEAIFIFYPASKKIKQSNDELKKEIALKTNELQKSIDIIDKNVIYSRTDLRGIITHASTAFSNMSGYSIDELIGKPHNIVRHIDMPKEAFKDMWQTIKLGKEWSGEVKNRKKDGGFYWVKAYIVPEYNIDGEHIGYAAVRHNITDRKEIEELNKNLEQKIKEEVSKSREKDHKIFEQDKRIQITEMIGNIAHQWRQPLSMISTCASGLQLKGEYGMLSDDILNEDTELIIETTNDLSNRLNTFSDFLRSENKVETFKFKELFNNIENIVKPSLNDKKIEFRFLLENNDLKIDTHKNDLTTVLLHIIYNARDIFIQREIKAPFIEVFVKKTDDEYFISIKDNGGGISKDIIGKIFDPYFTTKHQAIGTGMGLYTCQMIITNTLLGTISVENIANGAEFIIKIKNLTEVK